MASQRPWTLLDLRRDLPALYDQVHEKNALEPPAITFWSTFCEIWAQTKPYVFSISQQIPPDSDPNAPGRLRRIDFSHDAYDKKSNYVRFPLYYVEGKGAHASNKEIEKVEGQGFNACEGYVNSTRGRTSVAHCLCVVGTRARAFRYSSKSWSPLWGEEGDVDLDQYIDAATPESVKIWNALNTIMATCGVTMASPEDMPIKPPPSSAGVLRSNTSTNTFGSRLPTYGRAPQEPVAGSSTIVPRHGGDQQRQQMVAEALFAQQAYSRLIGQGCSPEQAFELLVQQHISLNPTLSKESAQAGIRGRLGYQGT
ncbi:hypothetical protein AC578_8768 [Pseudocercospora eumusae]|uniref:Uncharacterized protein n=1 Tax=Pseudocercospora eumusae TaxID=321146 RepID=A0A139H6D8_9PEZI|nr:hypothetical protein AC578_8768 [Pseudocercospora eumusae]